MNDQRLILIAERDEAVRELQRYFLGKAGFSTEFVGDGEAALQSAQLNAPAVVVTEILIPKIDGLALCRRLQDDPLTRHVPVVIFSILNAGARSQEAGAKAFLRKPLVESVFLATIQDLIAAPSSVKLEQQWASQS